MVGKTSPKGRRPRATAPSPRHLDKPEAALWGDIVGEYRFEDAASLALLAAALEARQRARRCREAIDREGETVKDRFEQVKAHPLLSAERDARAAFLAAMRMLSLDIAGEQK
jgi:hypothetical protein